MQSEANRVQRGRAIVMGASIAGLSAAAALVRHYESVLVLERDPAPTPGEHRRGVPQSHHPHQLLDGARHSLEQLLPGFDADLVRAGAMELNPGLVVAHLEPWGWSPRKATGETMLYASRVLIEDALRERVEALPGVEIRYEMKVRGFAWDGADKMRGVMVDSNASGGEEPLEAELVLDCTGKSSRAPKWFEAAGLPPIPTLDCDAKVTYATRWYRAPEDRDWWFEQMAVVPVEGGGAPEEHGYLGLLHPVEDGLLIALIGTWGGVSMPREAEAYEALAAKLRTPVFAETLSRCEPISDVLISGSTFNRWRRYHEWRPLPAGFLALGDSVGCFNPLYGMGMSVACLAAKALDDILAEGAEGSVLQQRFFDAQAEVLERGWSVALSRDAIHPAAEGTQAAGGTLKSRLLNKLSAPSYQAIVNATRESELVERRFFETFNTHAGLDALTRDPRVLRDVMRVAMRHALGRSPMPKHTPAAEWPSERIVES